MIIEFIRSWNVLEQWLFTVVCVWVFVHILKYIFKIKRPKESDLKTPGWPSAHTAAAASVLLFLNGITFGVGFIGTILVGYSRYYKKHHSMNDVVCGWILGIIVGGLLKWVLLII